MRSQRVYFDNAATSFPKPPRVLEAMAEYATRLGASPGRGAYRESVESGRLLSRVRERICRLIGSPSPEHVVFTLNATDALNLAIKGVVRARLRRGKPVHAIASAMEHNSILRPLNGLREEGLEWTCVACDPATGLVDPDDVRAAIRPDTSLIALGHASNVTGTIQPIDRVGAIAREAGVLLVVDAAQTLGHVPVDVEAMAIDLLAFPGHKGLLGPLGTGGLAIRPGVERDLEPLREGGTGSVSERDVQPEELPDRYEAGSHNTIGIAGLGAGVEYLLERGVELVATHEAEITAVLLEGLERLAPGVRVVGPGAGGDRLGVVSIVHETIPPAELAMLVEQVRGVLCRAGLHCAPRAHAALGTLEGGGTVRLSVGAFTTMEDVRVAIEALEIVCREARASV